MLRRSDSYRLVRRRPLARKLRVPDTRKVVDFRRCGGKRRARHRADHYAAKLSDRY